VTEHEARQAQIDLLEERCSAAEREMAARLNEALFFPPGGPYFVPAPVPPTPRWRTALRRLGWRWYAMREWIAVHVLRVEVAGDEEWN
jgi:hypothetical protein